MKMWKKTKSCINCTSGEKQFRFIWTKAVNLRFLSGWLTLTLDLRGVRCFSSKWLPQSSCTCTPDYAPQHTQLCFHSFRLPPTLAIKLNSRIFWTKTTKLSKRKWHITRSVLLRGIISLEHCWIWQLYAMSNSTYSTASVGCRAKRMATQIRCHVHHKGKCFAFVSNQKASCKHYLKIIV